MDGVVDARARLTCGSFVGSCGCLVTPKHMKLVCVPSPLSTQHQGERAKTICVGIRIMCPSGSTCLHANCCFRELALYKSNYIVYVLV